MKDHMLELIRILQNKSNFSTTVVCDLLMLDIEHNEGKIYSKLAAQVETIKELTK